MNRQHTKKKQMFNKTIQIKRENDFFSKFYNTSTIQQKNYPLEILYFDITRQTYIELIRRYKLEDVRVDQSIKEKFKKKESFLPHKIHQN